MWCIIRSFKEKLCPALYLARFKILTNSNSDKFQFWQIPILTNSNSDKFQFWQIPILTNSNSDKFQFWQIPILTNSNFFKKWQKTDSDKFQFWQIPFYQFNSNDHTRAGIFHLDLERLLNNEFHERTPSVGVIQQRTIWQEISRKSKLRNTSIIFPKDNWLIIVRQQSTELCHVVSERSRIFKLKNDCGNCGNCWRVECSSSIKWTDLWR